MTIGTLSEEEYQTLKDNLHLKSRELTKLLPNRTYASVRHYRLLIRQELSLVKRSKSGRALHDVDDEYFKDLDSRKCYWGGLLAADGSIKDNTEHSASFKLKLAHKDLCLLEQFKLDLGFTGQLHHMVETLNGKQYPQNALIVSSRQIVTDLRTQFNITPRKSLTLQPPNITDPELIKAFIIGYIDGDGNIGYCGKSETLQVLGTEELLNWIKYYLDLWYPVKTGAKVSPKSSSGKAYRYSISGIKVRQFVHDVRMMGLPILERKWYSIDTRLN